LTLRMLSVLIVNWNTRELLRACLRSIHKFSPSEPYEVIVVDNASTDGSGEMVRTEFPGVKLIECKTNTGYARGNNIAFAAAQGEFLLTLNPDTEQVDNVLQLAMDILRRCPPNIGCLAPRLVYPDGKTQHSVRGWPTPIGIFGDASGFGVTFPDSKFGSYRLKNFDYQLQQLAPQPMGTFLMFKREALAAVGDPKKPLDERFPIFFNEVDLLYRMHKAGWECLYAPALRVVHHGGESTKQVRKSMIWESHRSLVRYLKKHYRTPQNSLGLALFAGLLYVAAFVRARGYDAGFSA
jgi:N-acetylglucosaminyl-diphospho-decaprenol L-rhamnosyltransferase